MKRLICWFRGHRWGHWLNPKTQQYHSICCERCGMWWGDYVRRNPGVQSSYELIGYLVYETKFGGHWDFHPKDELPAGDFLKHREHTAVYKRAPGVPASFKVGDRVMFRGIEHEIFANGDRAGTFDICQPGWPAGTDRWLNVPPDQLTPADGVQPAVTPSAWWALVMGAASSIEDAANCLRDPAAKKQAEGAAKHYREAAQKLTAAYGVRDIHLPDGTVRHNVGSDNLSDEDRAAMELTDEQVDALNAGAAASGVQAPVPISAQQIAEWRKLQGEGLTSAVGEYTPEEFWTLLDAYEALARNAGVREDGNG